MVQVLLNKITLLRLDNIQFNNRLAFLINTLGVVIIIFSLVFYAMHNMFRIKHIVIEGDIKHVTPIQLTYVANNKLHGTFFTLNIDDLKSQFEVLPWVKQVVLQRQFPNTIIVKITEHNAIAHIGEEDLLAEDGEVFDGADNGELPTLYVSVDKASLAYEKYQQIESVITKHNDTVTKLWMSDPRIIKFTTESNLSVTICDQDFTTKLLEIDTYWDKLHQINPQLTSMNLCYKNAVAINTAQLANMDMKK